MDYGAFFADVQKWLGEVNQATVQYGLGSEQFWVWVADSSSAICKKYNDHRLAIKQMIMLVEWIEEVYEKQVSPK